MYVRTYVCYNVFSEKYKKLTHFRNYISEGGEKMTLDNRELYHEALLARAKYLCGDLDRRTAKEIIDPYIQTFNEKSKELAKKYNQRPKLISFSIFVR